MFFWFLSKWTLDPRLLASKSDNGEGQHGWQHRQHCLCKLLIACNCMFIHEMSSSYQYVGVIFWGDIVSLISRDFFEWFVIDKFNRRMIGLQIFRFAELCNRARLQKVDSTFNLTFKLRKPLLLERAIRYISKYCWVVFILM